jgi:hypothetical protein
VGFPLTDRKHRHADTIRPGPVSRRALPNE